MLGGYLHLGSGNAGARLTCTGKLPLVRAQA